MVNNLVLPERYAPENIWNFKWCTVSWQYKGVVRNPLSRQSIFWSQDPYNRYIVVVVVLWSIQKFCLKIAKIENCQNWKLVGLQVVKIASCQNFKLPKVKIAKIASCQSWKWFQYCLLKVSIFDELSCQNWKL